jgi:glycosyltransferase involved in cell wall biosynthesis
MTSETSKSPNKPDICLISRFFNLNNAGIGRFSMEIKNGLVKRGYPVTAIETKHRSDAGYFVYTAWELAYKIPKNQAVYHCLTPMEAIFAPKERTIVTFHDLIPLLHLDNLDTHYAQGRLKTIKKYLSNKWFGRAAKKAAKCAFVVCDSEQTKNEVIRYLGVDENKVIVIRLGIARGLEPVKKQDTIFRIGTLSYLDKRKRIDLLIDAFLKARIDGELIIGGSGPDKERLVVLAAGDKRINFSGFIPEEKMNDFYNSLDYFVFPSKSEGYGLPIVEAFACKKPVIVLNDGLIPNELKSRCRIVDNLLECLKKRSCESIEMIEDNYRFANTHNWDTCIEKYLDIYRQVQCA